MHTFDRSFSTENSWLRRLAVAEAIGLLSSLVLLLLAPPPLHFVSLVLSAIGLLAALAVIGILFSIYRRSPIVVEKQELLRTQGEHAHRLRMARVELARAQKERERISSDEQRISDQRQNLHWSTLEGISRRREKADSSEWFEIEDTLGKLQAAHLRDGLRRTQISATEIQGVGNKMAERLQQHGIQSAADVSVARVQAVPGFGEAKAASVAEWRDDIERRLRASAPQILPRETEAIIRRKYSEVRDGLNQEEATEHKDLREDLATIRETARAKHEANDEFESNAKIEAHEARSDLAEATDALEPYEQITFRKFLRESIDFEEAAGSRPKLAALGVAAGLAAGLICHTTSGIASVGSIYVASLPTATATATSTGTPTATATSTATFTPSASFTASNTPTPTQTLTPSNTPTASNTPTPSATIPDLEVMDCLPTGTLRQVARVVDVVDGDTIDVFIGEQAFSVRYIGIDAPESDDHLGYEATRKNRQFVEGQTVTLIKDVSETDNFDRLLRYVVVGNSFVNYEMVRQGFAYSSTYPPDVACQSAFNAAAQLAREEIRGLWIPTITPTATRNIVIVTATPGPGGSGNCHPSYPTVCIPPPPPDLDCGDISYRNFAVQGSDPHNFDGDGDGIGCES